MNFEDKPQSLLTFRVGPVLCCAPSLPVRSIIPPPKLTHPPGSDSGQPGIFKHGSHIIKVFDLRHKFGVDLSQQTQPGNLIITIFEKENFAFWVDQILDVFDFPSQGWGDLPAAIPRGVFSRTLLLNKKIHLYSEFEKLATINDLDYLKHYIQQLKQQSSPKTTYSEKKDSASLVPRKKPEAPEANKESAITNSAVHKANVDKPESISVIKKSSLENDKPMDKTKITPSAEINKTQATTNRTKTNTQATIKPVSTSASRTDKTIKAQSINKAASRTQINSTSPVSNLEKNTTPTLKSSSLNTTSPSNMSISSTRKTSQDDTESSAIGIILFFILLLSILGAGIYYVLLDDTNREYRYKKERTYIPPKSNYKEELNYADTENNFSMSKSTSDELHSPSIVNEEIIEKKEDEVNLVENKIKSLENNFPVAAPEEKVEGINSKHKELPPAQVTPEEEQNISEAEMVIKKESEAPLFTSEIDLIDKLAFRAEITKLDDEITITLLQSVTDEKQQLAESAAPLESVEENNPDERIISSPPIKTLNQKKSIKNDETMKIIKEVIHVVVKGDTLWAIAKKYVNNPFLYPELARLSNIKNPHRIYPGNRVKIRFIKK